METSMFNKDLYDDDPFIEAFDQWVEGRMSGADCHCEDDDRDGIIAVMS